MARPRLSILSLFDPLSSSSESLYSDKENDCGDTSFFHPYGSSNQVYSPVRRLHRRLVDVGDVTVGEPDIRDLIQEELEAEISQSVALEEDENATLTFRDMANAATPKWSGKHAARKRTQNALSSPRTPLAEIAMRDEITPTGNKKIFKRRTAHLVPEASPLNVVRATKEKSTLVVHDLDNISSSQSNTFVPRIAIFSSDNEMIKESTIPSPMATSTATLEIPTATGTLISDTPIPLFISSSSPEPDHTSMTENRLRPNTHVSESSNRHSVDLHASFQLHLSSSETTFNLLNDNISFLGSKNGLESFLDHEGASFGDEDFSTIDHGISNEMVSNEQRGQNLRTDLRIQPDVSKTMSEEHVSKPALQDVTSRPASFHERSGRPTSPSGKESSNTLQMFESDPHTPEKSSSEPVNTVLSTPNPSHPILHPPRPVPALRIVKRIRQAKVERDPKTRISSEKADSILTLHAPQRTLVKDASLILTNNSIKPGGQTKAKSKVALNDDQPANGPQRVLVTELSQIQGGASAKKSIPVQAKSINGPRRVPASDAIEEVRTKPVLPARPAKYACVGPPKTSGIPKPVSGRNARSKIPTAPNDIQRFGLQIEAKGFLGRRLAGK